MPSVPIDELMRQCQSMYKLVVIASKRAKGLAEGAPKFVEIDAKKVTPIALEEIRQGKIFYRDDEEPPAKAKGKKRTAKAGK